MKNIYYLLAFITVVFISSCDPMSGIYKQLDGNVQPSAQPPITFAVPTTYASIDLANTGITGLLNTKYSDYGDSSTAVVTFPLASGFALVADNLLSHNAYTLVAADYTVAGNTAAPLNDAGIIAFLGYKYPNPVTNQLAVITYQYVLTNVTPATGITTTDSFLYFGGSWNKIYTVSAAQYALANRGTNNYFLSGTPPAGDLANIPSILNTFLTTDPNVIATAKAGDVIYVSYKYGTTTQVVLPLTFDGTTWAPKMKLNFIKLLGTWVPDPTVYITIPVIKLAPDYIWLRDNTTIGSSGARSNVASFGDFNTSPTTSSTTWTNAEVEQAMAAILLHKIPNGVIGIPYKITYYVFPGANPVIPQTRTYKFNGTAYIIQK
ncbi:hypothetical protein KXQ82_12920 [Mucilaginibacter sp. HMF5004]|uniref:hypothetical protein n=1 Tax=Mucilaginibacter rivuli TaxID=2857527 RepID=UPI001C5D63FF|nr:hypothetical protein [Mucilaginibacter rivuli]MBW4890630.1 hypothetical protein [Mucilaginibacter rivuli]